MAVTFEIDLTHYEVKRMEFSYLDWLSAVGGLSSIIFAASNLIGKLQSPQMHMTSALFYPDEDNAGDDNDVERNIDQISNQIYTPAELQSKCCLTLKTKLATT